MASGDGRARPRCLFRARKGEANKGARAHGKGARCQRASAARAARPTRQAGCQWCSRLGSALFLYQGTSASSN